MTGLNGGLVHADYATLQSQNQMRVSIAVSGRNSVLSFSDYSAHTSQMPCPRQGSPRSRNVHACCLLSGVCDVHYSCPEKQIVYAPAKDPEPKIDQFAACSTLGMFAYVASFVELPFSNPVKIRFLCGRSQRINSENYDSGDFSVPMAICVQ